MQAKEIIKLYNYNYDRSLGVPHSLPYSLDSILLPNNEIAYHTTINEVYAKLQANLIYLYSLTKLSDNNIPVDYAKIASGTPTAFYPVSGAFKWISTDLITSNQSKPLSSYGLPQLDKFNDGKFYENNVLGGGSNLGFFVSNNYIYALTSNYSQNTIGVLLSANRVTESSQFTFSNLNSIAFDGNIFIYVADSGLDSVYKYDISNLIFEDNLIGRKILYVDSMGGTGTYQDIDKFNNPSHINIYERDLYVVDKNNYCVKVFDSNLNWKTTYRRKALFQQNNVTAFRVNPYNNLFYFGFEDKFTILTSELTIPVPPEMPKILEGNIPYDAQRSSITTNIDVNDTVLYNLSSFLLSGENIVDFSFSKVDKNIFYIITNKNIYKRFISKPDIHIGQFQLSRDNLYIDNFKFSYLETYDDNTDNLIVYGNRNNAGIFYSFLEDSNYITILTNNDLDFYTIQEIEIDPEEYSQDWVFSKANHKILLNILAMRDRIVKRFAGKYDGNGNLLFFGTLYLLDNEIQKEQFDLSLNYFVGINEMFSNSVINRSIKKFYSLQTQMLSVLRDAAINVYPPLTSIRVVT